MASEDLCSAGSLWEYKGKGYTIISLQEVLSQDALGDWVPTVHYKLAGDFKECPGYLEFYRPYTDFLSKFERRSV